CFESMVHRDHPDPARRTGLMGLDSARVAGGSETTTYDSLDPSLAQARGNLYVGGKLWAAYVVLEKIFAQGGRPDLAAAAAQQARRAAATMLRHVQADGTIPAIIGQGDGPGSRSKIIPAIEGLVFPYFSGRADAVQADGTIPAIIGQGDGPGSRSKIIPAIEGLVFPYFSGRADAVQADGPYGHYVRALARHLDAVLTEGVCLFPDGGWKISSTSDN